MRKKAVVIVAILSLMVIGIVIGGQALVYLLGVTFNPGGQIVNPTPFRFLVVAMAHGTWEQFPNMLGTMLYRMGMRSRYAGLRQQCVRL